MITEAELYVRMVPLKERNFSQFEVMSDARQMLTRFCRRAFGGNLHQPISQRGTGTGAIGI
jgi:hypothetical protein